MTEWKRPAQRRAEDYADRDERDEASSRADEAQEPTYRDGTVRHECWKGDD